MTPAQIARLRARLGLTAAGLAQALTDLGYPVSHRTVERWAIGRRPGKLLAAGLARLSRRARQ